MDANGNGKFGFLDKLRNVARRQQLDSDVRHFYPIRAVTCFTVYLFLKGGGVESPDLDFVYADTDSHANEIAELYSYTEQPELQLNVKAFEDQMEQYGLPPCWQRLQNEERKSVLMKLLNQLEVSNKPLRMKAARCILYIAQVRNNIC